MSKMITFRLSEERLEELDALVSGGLYGSRAAALKAALDRFLKEEHERAIDCAIVEGYTRVPPTAEEDAYARASAIESIREEPW
jgi:Arc/MetJ-type ribon-helix-helix transcriptional regulator